MELGIEVNLPEYNAAQRQRQLIAAGVDMREIFATVVAGTRETYAAALGSTAEMTR
jgi:hypothetical protein